MMDLFQLAFYTTALTLIATLIPLPLTTAKNIVTSIKLALVTSTASMFIFFDLGAEMMVTQIRLTISTFDYNFTTQHDAYTVTFIPIALYITWAVLDHSNWYFSNDPRHTFFAELLLWFLVAMLTLTTSSSLMQLFVGWEAVGIISFLLIGWWHARTNANSSALQAIIYNRIGDMGLILAMAWLAMNYNTWDMQQVFSHQQTQTLPTLGLILAAMGKSAQFGLHPWLPAAMEGPTPVSALLHSSTMVVAGIFLLIRMHPMFFNNQLALTLCLLLGAMTTTYAALCATTQNDIKKIIAFSTSSQLGLMMLTVGMNQPKLAFLHICTHAFFKAMLFLCAGSIIHNLNNEQDIRKMGGLQKTMPITTTCLTIGSLALAGMPFLAGFYTKDTIIETMLTSPLNAWALLITMTATSLTAAYSTRLIFLTQLSAPRYPPTIAPNEDNTHQIWPILRLAIGSIAAGLVLTNIMLPTKPQIMTMPTTTKLLALLVTITGLICALDIMQRASFMTPHSPRLLHTATTQLGFFNTMLHRTVPTNTMTTAQLHALQLNDALWWELVGPTATKHASIILTKKLSATHTGSIKSHLLAFASLLLLMLPLIYL
uniref:NADH-ubiquinone oxidoreductase chain 5 n=1 Tax=Tropiocolotes tripolitanus TaxID=930273 RepID=A0A0A1HAL4_9SAUR|nr:NADH dehydrogenase subunit 5 [Tropiocolotes tripolitanus]